MGRRIYEGTRDDGIRVMLIERIAKPRFVIATDEKGVIDYEPLGNDREFALDTYIRAFDIDTTKIPVVIA